jgi:predicted metal-dependent hydrolase
MSKKPDPNRHFIEVSNIRVEIVRKNIKNLHLGVYPPDGRVRVATPTHVTDDNVRLAVISKLAWIKKQRAGFQAQPRQSEREMISGESHSLFGRHYRLEVVERHGRHEVKIKNNSWLTLYIRPGTSGENREKVINEWYRAQLKAHMPKLLKKWQDIIGIEVNAWGIKKMKTKWGSCNIAKKTIWLNLELAKKPPECLEYILVHELVHLLERHHNERFRQHMDRFMPHWQLHRETLKRFPLAHEDWRY